MRIGQLAKAGGVTVETVRYYQRILLLPEPGKPYSGFRSYGADDLARLHFIKRVQQLGFSLNEIEGLLRLSSADCAGVQKLARSKLTLVHGKLEDLARMAEVLEGVLRRCAKRRAHEGCPIIASLAEDTK